MIGVEFLLELDEKSVHLPAAIEQPLGRHVAADVCDACAVGCLDDIDELVVTVCDAEGPYEQRHEQALCADGETDRYADLGIEVADGSLVIDAHVGIERVDGLLHDAVHRVDDQRQVRLGLRDEIQPVQHVDGRHKDFRFGLGQFTQDRRKLFDGFSRGVDEWDEAGRDGDVGT